MKTTVDALKDLYVAMGGDADDVANITLIPDMIVAIAEIYTSGGGTGLPEVTDADNGDILTVVDGAWAKASAPTELPAVTADDNGDVLTVVEGAWAKATP